MDFSEVTFYKIHILVVECRLSDPVFFYIGNIDVEGGTYPSRPPPPLEGPQDPPPPTFRGSCRPSMAHLVASPGMAVVPHVS